MNQEKHYIFHITHIDNLREIIQQGQLFSKNAVGNGHIDIAHSSVQNLRNKTVKISPFGSLHDYVPFYFGRRSPMLLAISNNKVMGYDEGQTPIIYLVSSVEWCKDNQLQFAFTDGHAAMDLTTFYNNIKDLDKINFEATEATSWFDDHDHIDRKRQKQSEFLVKNEFPWQGILGVATINQTMKGRVTTIYDELWSEYRPKVVIRRGWYY